MLTAGFAGLIANNQAKRETASHKPRTPSHPIVTA